MFFPYFVHSFFDTYFWMFFSNDFSHFSDFLFLGESSATRILLDKTYGFRTFTFIEKDVFLINTFLENNWIFVSFPHRNFSNFHEFRLLNFCMDCLSIFDGKLFPKWSKTYLGIDTFGDIFRRPIFWYILVVLRLILVAPWLTFGSLLAPLGCLLVPFGFLLAHFWCPWDHFCSPLRSMFTLLRSPGVIFNSFWNFRWVSYVNSYFFEKSMEIQLICFYCRERE